MKTKTLRIGALLCFLLAVAFFTLRLLSDYGYIPGRVYSAADFGIETLKSPRDADGDGIITNLDALLLLYAINDKYNLTAEEFARADLNGDGELWAAEALRILQYVSGTVGSVKM